ncbi:MAG: tetratricopeptide repeat protein [candidate division KSB1 bacterium]|nr:tetratricopeptide repeat protein [candidate division KSB1 bacterium]
MHKYFDIQLRHAIYFVLRLDQLNKMYLRGGENIATALKLIIEDWENIKLGQAWAAKNSRSNPKAAELTVDYPDAGTQILLLYQHPLQRIEWRKAALAVSQQLNHTAAEGAHLANLGLAYLDLGQLPQAVDYFLPALEKLTSVNDQKGVVVVHINLGNAYLLMGQAEDAMQQFEQALQLSRHINDRRSQGNALVGMGSILVTSRRLNEAIDLYQQALRIIREIKNKRAEATLLADIGIAYLEIGQFHQAQNWFKEALLIARNIGDQDIEFHCVSNIGRVYLNLGNYHQARDYFDEALHLATAMENARNRAIALGNLGFVCENLGDLKDAATDYQEALTIFQQINDQTHLGHTLLNLSSVFLKSDDVQLALMLSLKAYRIARNIKDSATLVNVLGIQGTVYQLWHKYRRAQCLYEQQFKLAGLANYVRGQGAALWNLALVYSEQGDRQKAIEFGNKALEIYDTREYPELALIKKQLAEWLKE